jgi:prepilin-type N-terminal cleavage/methylation domain-containing protein
MSCAEPQPKHGFTLVELLLAIMVGSMVAVTGLWTFRSVTQDRAMLQYYSDMAAEGRFALNQMRADLANFYRSDVAERMWLAGTDGRTRIESNRLSLRVVSDRAECRGEHEGDVYEVEYSIKVGTAQEGYLLLRRCTQPVGPVESGAAHASTLLTRHVRQLHFSYFDGREWHDEWDSKTASLPRMVRISLELGETTGTFKPLALSQTISLVPLPTESRPERLYESPTSKNQP